MEYLSSKKYLFPKELANYYGVTLSTVRRWVKEGKLPAVQTSGGHSRILKKEFMKFIGEKEGVNKTQSQDKYINQNKVLVVDDNENILALLSTMFKSKGYGVTTCGNGQEALGLLSNDEYSYILSDIKMPVMDGKTFLCEIKKRYRKNKVIMMSGDRNYQIIEYQLCGAFDILVKPIGLDILYNKVRKLGFEKRSAIRFPMKLPVMINNSINGDSVNLSGDGMLMTTLYPIARGTEIKVQMIGKENKALFIIAGTVIRTGQINSIYNIAVYFVKNIGQELAHLYAEKFLIL